MTRVRVGVLACSKSKLAHAAPAVELYTGRTFRAALALLRLLGCVRVVVLSALYGAVDGARVIEPYERTLLKATKGERERWAARTGAELLELVPEGAEVLAVLPAAYLGALEALPAGSVVRLLGGLPQGRLYSALAGAPRAIELHRLDLTHASAREVRELLEHPPPPTRELRAFMAGDDGGCWDGTDDGGPPPLDVGGALEELPEGGDDLPF